jgi:hypothetical protein
VARCGDLAEFLGAGAVENGGASIESHGHTLSQICHSPAVSKGPIRKRHPK